LQEESGDEIPLPTLLKYHGSYRPTCSSQFHESEQSLQYLLGKSLRKRRLDDFKASVQDAGDLAWMVSCSDKFAGIWLEAVPKSSALEIDSK
jgi:hypothetical protein